MTRRDRGLTALFLGLFAAGWFGWAQATVPPSLHAWLGAGSGLSLTVAAVGAAIGRRSPAGTGGLRDPGARRGYRITVGSEFALAGLGAALLAVVGRSPYTPVWICAVVAVHFFPLARVLRDRSLILLGILLSAISLAALATGLATHTAPGTVTGIGAGLALLTFAARAARSEDAHPRAARTPTVPAPRSSPGSRRGTSAQRRRGPRR